MKNRGHYNFCLLPRILVTKKNNKRRRLRKNKKGIDREMNKIVLCGKKWKKMFHVLHRVDMRACYAKHKINLACPKLSSDDDFMGECN